MGRIWRIWARKKCSRCTTRSITSFIDTAAGCESWADGASLGMSAAAVGCVEAACVAEAVSCATAGKKDANRNRERKVDWKILINTFWDPQAIWKMMCNTAVESAGWPSCIAGLQRI